MRAFIFLTVILVVTGSVSFGQTPTTAGGWNALGSQQFTNKDYSGAIKSFTECIKLKSDAAYCYQNRSSSYTMTKNYELAIADAYSWSKFSSKPVPAAYLTVTFIRLEQKRWSDVINAANDGIKLFPTEPTFYYYRGVAYANAGKNQEALADATKSIELKPTADHYLLRSHIYCNQMDLKSAEADEMNVRAMGGKIEMGCYDSAAAAAANLKNKPASSAPVKANRPEAEKWVAAAEAELSKAGEAMEKGNMSETAANLELALVYIDQAVAQDALYAKAFQTRGIIYFTKAMLPTNKDATLLGSALIAFDKVIELDPKYAKAYFAKGLVSEQWGHKANAKLYFQQALHLDPTDKDAQMGLKRVRK